MAPVEGTGFLGPFLEWLCSGWHRQQGVFTGAEALESPVRMIRIIVLSPRLDLGAGVLQRLKPMYVQAFVPEAAIERFDRRVVGRLAPMAEVQDDLIGVRSEIHRGADELAAVVAVDPLRQPAIEAEPLERRHDILAGEPAADGDVEALEHAPRHATGRP